jgi:DNA N-6-adenine-methyltransferase (Dam)
MTDNRVLTLMGSAHPNAMRGLATGAEGAVREQQIHTPECVLAVARETFGGTIWLDPCASPAREPFAVYNTYEASGNGLETEWEHGTFVNPPYKHLKDWLAKSAQHPHDSHMILCPVRTNRSWWCAYASNVCAIAWLKPLKFEGYAQAFPAPLCLFYIGGDVHTFAAEVLNAGIAHKVTGPLR